LRFPPSLLLQFNRFLGILRLHLQGTTPSLVYCSTPITYATSETTIALQDVLDGIMPGVVPLMYTLLMYYLLSKKKVSAVLLMVGTMVLGIVCVYLGILA